jgi:hypothetical protein
VRVTSGNAASGSFSARGTVGVLPGPSRIGKRISASPFQSFQLRVAMGGRSGRPR